MADRIQLESRGFMSNRELKVLAVADPAVNVYVDSRMKLLQEFGKHVCFDVVPWAEYYKKMLESMECYMVFCNL
jgi:multiple sugar transport system substrate-binding protein